MQTAILGIIIITIVFSGYHFVKYIFHGKQNKVIQKARIDKITLHQIGDLWSPEVYLTYYFAYNKKTYWGKDYIRIDALLPAWELLLFDRNNYPILRSEVGEFAGEEHIEAFILSQVDNITIEFNTFTLPESKIHKARYGIKGEIKPLFQNLDIKFPWT